MKNRNMSPAEVLLVDDNPADLDLARDLLIANEIRHKSAPSPMEKMPSPFCAAKDNTRRHDGRT
jgi:hypothetical protein